MNKIPPEKLERLRELVAKMVQQRKEQEAKRIVYEPIYDDVYWEGVRCLDENG